MGNEQKGSILCCFVFSPNLSSLMRLYLGPRVGRREEAVLAGSQIGKKSKVRNIVNCADLNPAPGRTSERVQ